MNNTKSTGIVFLYSQEVARMDIPNFDQILDNYAELVVDVGLNLQPGQQLVILAKPLEVAPLVRRVVKQAYKKQSRFVTVIWLDQQLDKIRFNHAPKDSFEEFSSWVPNGILESIEEGAAFLQVSGVDPNAYSDVSPEILGTINRVLNENMRPISTHRGIPSMQWNVVCPPTPGWAMRVFPDDEPEDAQNKLWKAVIKACRLEEENPVAFWEIYLEKIRKRAEFLTKKAYQSLIFTGPGTNLNVGLPVGHIWKGGSQKTIKDLLFTVNLPTEEVFTLPHKEQTNGKVSATFPLNYQGMFIDKFWLRFSEGKVVEYGAETGEEFLGRILDTDPNARFLGEVAIVPHKTPISQSGLIFINTLYDENASNHLALGRAFPHTLVGGPEMTKEEFSQAGGNSSLVHADFMFGSEEMDVDGILADGSSEPVIREGEWAFEL
jgi:aminopeptidase